MERNLTGRRNQSPPLPPNEAKIRAYFKRKLFPSLIRRHYLTRTGQTLASLRPLAGFKPLEDGKERSPSITVRGKTGNWFIDAPSLQLKELLGVAGYKVNRDLVSKEVVRVPIKRRWVASTQSRQQMAQESEVSEGRQSPRPPDESTYRSIYKTYCR